MSCSKCEDQKETSPSPIPAAECQSAWDRQLLPSCFHTDSACLQCCVNKNKLGIASSSCAVSLPF